MKKRESSFELLRLIAMAMIVLIHCNFYTIGAPNEEEFAISPLSSFLRILIQQVCIIGVNVFVLISGWFGIKPSNKGVCSLLFQIFFWGFVSLLFARIFNLSISLKDTLRYFYFGASLWFIPSYIILYCLSPVLNTFVAHSTHKTLLLTCFSFFIVEFFFGWLKDYGSYRDGYSALSFIGLYLLARYLKMRQMDLCNIRNNRNKAFCIFLLCTFIPSIICFCSGYLAHLNTEHCSLFSILQESQTYYNSPFVILSAASILWIFSTIKINSNFINGAGSSAFAVYLFHMHPCISKQFLQFTTTHYHILPHNLYALFAILLMLLLFAFCIPVDNFRLFCWRFLCSITAGIKQKSKRIN